MLNNDLLECINNINLCNSIKDKSKLIDELLIPSINEKKQNSEISTPYKLRQEMLDKIPVEFWKKIHKVFEPCCGKGGFVVDIIDRFMDGLSELIEDEKERYRVIVEECLYYSDINPLNIFIVNLLINGSGEYKLNYNEGDTLELDIMEKWGLEGFDAVIGNPPYKKGKNSNFYINFINLAINKLNINGINLYVIPNRFLITNHKCNIIIKNMQVELIKHSENIFNVATDIGYYIAYKYNIVNNSNIKCIFKNDEIYNIDLNISTPTKTNKLEIKKLSDKILYNDTNKIDFIKGDKTKMDKNKYIFIPRHWTLYSSKKVKGGKHIFNILNDFGDDGRYVKYDINTKDKIIWYLSRSKIIRFITCIYASSVYIPPFIWLSIPKINYDIINNDKDLYEYFNLTEEEINLIEETID